jgi:hypothetical protein
MKLRTLRKSAAQYWAKACRAYERDVRIIEALEEMGFEPYKERTLYEKYHNPDIGHWSTGGRPYLHIEPLSEAEAEYYIYHLQEIFGIAPDFRYEHHVEFYLEKVKVGQVRDAEGYLTGGEVVDIRVALPQSETSCRVSTKLVPATGKEYVQIIDCGEYTFQKGDMEEAHAGV